MQTAISIVIIFIWMLPIPAAVGVICTAMSGRQKRSLTFAWVSGQIVLWAIFQLVSVPGILKQWEIRNRFGKTAFEYLLEGYSGLGIGLAAVGILIGLFRFLAGRRKTSALRSAGKIRSEEDDGTEENILFSCSAFRLTQRRFAQILWGIFVILLVLQLVMAATMTYRDEDDAFYVAVASITEESNGMFEKPPYTGGSTRLDARHGLAPFSIWMAFLARVSGIPAVSVAHICVPMMSILLAYSIYYLIGQKLVRGKETLPLYMVLVELLILFGDVSRYTSENFLLARSRQGKATLGSIVVPIIIYLMLEIMERMQEQKKIQLIWWILLMAAVTTGCLCSTLGAVVVCVLVGLGALCSALCYSRPLVLLPFFLCCMPAVCYAYLYLILK